MRCTNTSGRESPPVRSAKPPLIAILLCTYDGERFIAQQIESFFEQTYKEWELWVSDDGSHDNTLKRIQSFEGRGKKINILSGPKSGYAANFLTLIRNKELIGDYFAWADQDDIWLPEKLERAVHWLVQQKDTPALYSSRTELIDSANNILSYSPHFLKTACFRNALCQNIGGGNTMVFNQSARDILLQGELPDVIAHDWWAYMLITGVGGVFYFDKEPSVKYRQHTHNQLGENRTIRARLSRFFRIVSGEYHEWNARNIVALSARGGSLTQENLFVFNNFSSASREVKRLSRLKRVVKSGIYRQSRLDNLVLYIMTLLRKYP